MTVCELNRRVRSNIDHGVIGLPGDYEALNARLDACETEAEIDAFRRMATRWEWAVEMIPDHISHEDAMRMTAA